MFKLWNITAISYLTELLDHNIDGELVWKMWYVSDSLSSSELMQSHLRYFFHDLLKAYSGQLVLHGNHAVMKGSYI
jgi:hypothetical protein